jgi:hypothetical protein
LRNAYAVSLVGKPTKASDPADLHGGLTGAGFFCKGRPNGWDLPHLISQVVM